MENFIEGLAAIFLEIKEFFIALAFNKSFMGFAAGAVITVLITGLVLTKNPKQIPTILRYDSMQGFQRLSQRSENGTFEHSYSGYVKLHAQIRLLAMIAIIAFFIMITAIVLKA